MRRTYESNMTLRRGLRRGMGGGGRAGQVAGVEVSGAKVAGLVFFTENRPEEREEVEEEGEGAASSPSTSFTLATLASSRCSTTAGSSTSPGRPTTSPSAERLE